MDVAVLNDARDDLASRLAQVGIVFLAGGTNVGDWIAELEDIYPPSVINASLEYAVATHPACNEIEGVEDAIEFYLDSLREHKLTSPR
jgi:hypothetical protein